MAVRMMLILAALSLAAARLAAADDGLPQLTPELYSLGIGGVILAIVVLPVLNWMFREMRQQRENFAKFIDEHATRSEELSQGLRLEIGRMADMLNKLYSAQVDDTRSEVRRLRDIIGQLPFHVPRPLDRDKPGV